MILRPPPSVVLLAPSFHLSGTITFDNFFSPATPNSNYKQINWSFDRAIESENYGMQKRTRDSHFSQTIAVVNGSDYYFDCEFSDWKKKIRFRNQNKTLCPFSDYSCRLQALQNDRLRLYFSGSLPLSTGSYWKLSSLDPFLPRIIEPKQKTNYWQKKRMDEITLACGWTSFTIITLWFTKKIIITLCFPRYILKINFLHKFLYD